jgi:hypothetical protein
MSVHRINSCTETLDRLATHLCTPTLRCRNSTDVGAQNQFLHRDRAQPCDSDKFMQSPFMHLLASSLGAGLTNLGAGKHRHGPVLKLCNQHQSVPCTSRCTTQNQAISHLKINIKVYSNKKTAFFGLLDT